MILPQEKLISISELDYFEKCECPKKHEKSLQSVFLLIHAAPISCLVPFSFRLNSLSS